MFEAVTEKFVCGRCSWQFYAEYAGQNKCHPCESKEARDRNDKASPCWIILAVFIASFALEYMLAGSMFSALLLTSWAIVQVFNKITK